jgi:hypothetical protein
MEAGEDRTWSFLIRGNVLCNWSSLDSKEYGVIVLKKTGRLPDDISPIAVKGVGCER